MSLGATMSAPACDVAGGGAGEQFQSGVVEDPGAGLVAPHDAAMAMLHVFAQANVGDDQQVAAAPSSAGARPVGRCRWRRRRRRLWHPSGRECRTAAPPARPIPARWRLRAAIHRARAGTRLASSAMGCRSLRPLRTNNGKTSCPAFKCVSRTNWRRTGDWRRRRGRYAGNCPTRGAFIEKVYALPQFKATPGQVVLNRRGKAETPGSSDMPTLRPVAFRGGPWEMRVKAREGWQLPENSA